MDDAIVSVRSGPLQPDEVAFIAAHPGLSAEQMQSALYNHLNILRTATDLVEKPAVRDKKSTAEKPAVSGKRFKNWPEEAIEMCLVENPNTEQIAEQITERFGIPATVRSVRSVRHKFCTMTQPQGAENRLPWTDEELQFMWDNVDAPRKDAIVRFHEKFPGARTDPSVATKYQSIRYLWKAQQTGDVSYPDWTPDMIQFVRKNPQDPESVIVENLRAKFGVETGRSAVNSIRDQIEVAEEHPRCKNIIALRSKIWDCLDKEYDVLPDRPNRENVLNMLKSVTLGANRTALENRLICYAVVELLDALRTSDNHMVDWILER